MNISVRHQPLSWGSEFQQEIDGDHPDLPQNNMPERWFSGNSNSRQGFKNRMRTHKTKLETAEKAWLNSLPWSYAQAVSNPNNKQPRQRRDSNQEDIGSTNADQNWQCIKGIIERNQEKSKMDESDVESHLNPNANEFFPIKSEDSDISSNEDNKSTTENDIDEINELSEEPSEDVETLNTESTPAGDSEDNLVIEDHNSGGNDSEESEKVNDISADKLDSVTIQDKNNQVDFIQDHFGTKEINIEPFETVSTGIEEECIMDLPDNVQSKNQNTILSKNECTSFGDELNFEELIKKKSSYSENHFSIMVNDQAIDNAFAKNRGKNNQYEKERQEVESQQTLLNADLQCFFQNVGKLSNLARNQNNSSLYEELKNHISDDEGQRNHKSKNDFQEIDYFEPEDILEFSMIFENDTYPKVDCTELKTLNEKKMPTCESGQEQEDNEANKKAEDDILEKSEADESIINLQAMSDEHFSCENNNEDEHIIDSCENNNEENSDLVNLEEEILELDGQQDEEITEDNTNTYEANEDILEEDEHIKKPEMDNFKESFAEVSQNEVDSHEPNAQQIVPDLLVEIQKKEICHPLLDSNLIFLHLGVGDETNDNQRIKIEEISDENSPRDEGQRTEVSEVGLQEVNGVGKSSTSDRIIIALDESTDTENSSFEIINLSPTNEDETTKYEQFPAVETELLVESKKCSEQKKNRRKSKNKRRNKNNVEPASTTVNSTSIPDVNTSINKENIDNKLGEFEEKITDSDQKNVSAVSEINSDSDFGQHENNRIHSSEKISILLTEDETNDNEKITIEISDESSPRDEGQRTEFLEGGLQEVNGSDEIEFPVEVNLSESTGADEINVVTNSKSKTEDVCQLDEDVSELSFEPPAEVTDTAEATVVSSDLNNESSAEINDEMVHLSGEMNGEEISLSGDVTKEETGEVNEKYSIEDLNNDEIELCGVISEEEVNSKEVSKEEVGLHGNTTKNEINPMVEENDEKLNSIEEMIDDKIELSGEINEEEVSLNEYMNKERIESNRELHDENVNSTREIIKEEIQPSREIKEEVITNEKMNDEKFDTIGEIINEKLNSNEENMESDINSIEDEKVEETDLIKPVSELSIEVPVEVTVAATATRICSAAVGSLTVAVEELKEFCNNQTKSHSDEEIRLCNDERNLKALTTEMAVSLPTAKQPVTDVLNTPASKITSSTKANAILKPSSPIRPKDTVPVKAVDKAKTAASKTAPSAKLTASPSKTLSKSSVAESPKLTNSATKNNLTTKSVTTAKPAASGTKPVPVKNSVNLKPSTPPAKAAVGSSKAVSSSPSVVAKSAALPTKTSLKPTTPPSKTNGASKPAPLKTATPPTKATGSDGKPVSAKSVTPTTKPPGTGNKPTTNKSVAPPAKSSAAPKPSTPPKAVGTSSKTVLSTKPVTPVTKSGITASSKAVPSKAKPTTPPGKTVSPAIKTPSSPSPTKKPVTPTSKTSQVTPKPLNKPTAAPAKSLLNPKLTSATAKTSQPVKKPDNVVLKQTTDSSQSSSVTSTNEINKAKTQANPAAKTVLTKVPASNLKQPSNPATKQAPTDKSKAALPVKSTPLVKKGVTDKDKKTPLNGKKTSTTDKNAKNISKSEAEDTSKPNLGEVNEHQLVTSTTGDILIEKDISQLEELPTQIIV